MSRTNRDDMTNFLTSQEMQDLISVDRSTVYRMAEDGRLPGVKIGRQWRFPADRVAAQLGLSGTLVQSVRDAPPSRQRRDVGLAELLPSESAQPIVDLMGELFGVMAVITDLDGHAITTVANPCGYYAAIADQPGAVEACLAQWRMFADEPNVSPRWVRTHLGFLCARTFIWVDLTPIGMIVVGGVTPVNWPPDARFVASVADEVGVGRDALVDVVDQTFDLDIAAQRRVLRLLPQMGDFVSQIASAKSATALTNTALTNTALTNMSSIPQGGAAS